MNGRSEAWSRSAIGSTVETRTPLGHFNPLFLKHLLPEIMIHALFGNPQYHSRFSLNMSTDLQDTPATSSWRRMYLSQPPTRRMWCILHLARARSPEEYDGTYQSGQHDPVVLKRGSEIKNENGITVADLVDQITELEAEAGGKLDLHNNQGIISAGDLIELSPWQLENLPSCARVIIRGRPREGSADNDEESDEEEGDEEESEEEESEED
ncbi:hypothetical protein Slin15195_G082430 [Septoria linicola]|uniref:Uncharacterized protein n=1 Tax=Septoria linicola TaxID=215465 RepID=A0A9Q9AUA6_9PEZI|nr:hypothetical protein Slin15195_G082430 [Septoria linicola]